MRIQKAVTVEGRRYGKSIRTCKQRGGLLEGGGYNEQGSVYGGWLLWKGRENVAVSVYSAPIAADWRGALIEERACAEN